MFGFLVRKPTTVAKTIVPMGLMVWLMMHCLVPDEGGLRSSLDDPMAPHYVFRAKMDGYYGVGAPINGVRNPVIEVREGALVKITISNTEDVAHDIALDEYEIQSSMLIRRGEVTSVEFRATVDDQYYCTVPGHREAGMVGDLKVIP